MEFTQYVLDVIASIDYMEKRHDIRGISLVREASEKAPSEAESHILNVIAGAVTMYYEEEECSFGPSLVWNDGTRSFAPEDLTGDDLDVLRGVIKVTGSLYLRTKFAHIVWSLTRDNRYGELAVAGYLDGFQKYFDPDNWVECYEQIHLAYHIASVIGNKSESFRKTRMAINQTLIQLNGSDSLFLSLKLMELIMGDVQKESLLKYDSIMSVIVDRNLDPVNRNMELADTTFSVLEKLYRRLKKENELKTAKTRYARYYETQAKSLVCKNDYLSAVFVLKKACVLYKGIDQEKWLELRLLLEDWQKTALQKIPVHKFEIDSKPAYDAVEQMFEGLSLTEAIVQFGRVAKIYHVKDVQKKLLENQEQSVFTSMFGSSLLNRQGQSVQELPPIKKVTDFGDLNAMKKHMVRYVTEQRRLYDNIPVRIAYQFLNKYNPITEDTLDFLVLDNAIVPEDRAEIIKQGLCMGLNGKLYAAMHILQPQTENIFRNLVRMCGDTVTFLKDDGSEEYKPLSSLFKSEKLLECYDENIIFTFQSIMDEPAGENLRNLNGHGLLEPTIGNSSISLYFLSLLVFLLSLYGANTLSILVDLAERERLETDKKKQ